MMRRLTRSIFLALLVLVLWAGFAMPAQADVVMEGYSGDLTWRLDSDGVLTISGSGAMQNFSSSGSAPWYNYRSQIRQATIGEGVTSVGNYAFTGSSVQGISIPASVTEIGAYAFDGCSSLTNISVNTGNSNFSSVSGVLFDKAQTTLIRYPGGKSGSYSGIPGSVTSIGDRAFYSCRVTGVTIPAGVASIGDYAFYSCTSLTRLDMPDSVTSMGSHVCDGCTALTSASLSSGLAGIGAYTFNKCSALSYVTIPEGITSIGEAAFYQCTKLQSLSLPQSLREIGNSAFYLTGLTSLDLPDGVTSLGSSAFYGCSSLRSFIIPTGVSQISNSLFYNCYNLASITLPDSITSISSSVFSGCSSLAEIRFYGTESQWDSITGKDNVASIVTYYYDNGAWAMLPSAEAASGTTGLNHWSLTQTGILTISGSSGIFSNFVKTSGSFPSNNSISSSTKHVVIESGVTAISESAFSGFSQMYDIKIPDSVTSIGASAFSRCSNLKSVEIPASVTAIGDSVFRRCSALTSVSIPENVTSIGQYAFSGCTKLNRIALPTGLTSLGAYAFAGCTGLTSISIPGVSAIGARTFDYCFNLTAVALSDGIGSIGTYAFYRCPNLRFVSIPRTVGSIESNAFHCDAENGYTYNEYNYDYDYADGSMNVNSLSDVYYAGTEAEWNAISISENYILRPSTSYGYTYSPYDRVANVHYNSGMAAAAGSPLILTKTVDANTQDTTVALTACASAGADSLRGTLALPSTLTGGASSSSGLSGFTYNGGSQTIAAGSTIAYYTHHVSNSDTPDASFSEGDYTITYTFQNNEIPTLSYAYSIREYTITVSPAEHGMVSVDKTKASAGDLITLTATPADNYELVSLYYTTAAGKTYTVNSSFSMPGSDITVHAVFQGGQHTVRFDASAVGDSASYSTKTVRFGESYGSLPSVYFIGYEYPGYTFDGWYTAAQGGTKVTESTIYTLTTDQTLYARLKGGTYTVTLDTNLVGAAVSPGSISVTYGQPYGTLPTPSKSGYNFDGWYTAAQGGTQVTENTPATFPPPGYYSTGWRLYAHWKGDSHTVTFDAGAGASVSPNSATVYNGSAYGALPVPSRTGYNFDGWYTAAQGGTQVMQYTAVSLTSDQTLYAHWTAGTYTVTLDTVLTGAAVSPGSVRVTYDQPYGNIPTPGRIGYSFDGWYTAAEAGTQVLPTTAVTTAKDHTLYAHWTGETYTVTLDTIFEDVSVSPADISVTYGQPYGALAAPEKAGHVFDGWYTDAEGGTKILATTAVSIVGNHTLYAHWSTARYTVTFNTNAEGVSVSPANVNVTYGSAYGTLPTPTRAGFVFDGWYTAAEGGTKVEAGTAVSLTADHTLYAHWNGNTVVVVFDANGGNVSPAIKTVKNGSAYGTLPVPTRDGYNFVGWYTEAEGGIRVESTAVVLLTDYQTLYAHWTARPVTRYTVTFDAAGGSVSPASKDIIAGETYGTLPTPTRPGFSFDGWYTAAEGGEQVGSGAGAELTGNQTLYAHWSGNSCIVLFDANGGTVATTFRTVKNGAPYGELPTPRRADYAFTGWYTEAEGGSRIDSATVVMLTDYQTLYAHWTESASEVLTFTVSFDAGGGSVSPASKEVTTGQAYGALPTPARDGFSFDGWFTSAGGGEQVGSDTRVELAEDQTLYAHWTGNSYIVAFDANGGYVSLAIKQVKNGGLYGDLPAPVLAGYSFDGWYTEAEGGELVEGSDTVMLTDYQTLYAHWKVRPSNVYTVTFDPGEGSVGTEHKDVTYGEAYGTLPTPTRPGFSFDGWYSAEEGGTRAESTTTVTRTRDHTLYAHWTGNSYIVVFDANGGSVSSTVKTVKNGALYGDLPTAARPGYNFVGWYTQAEGGDRVESMTPVMLTDYQTLYARWSARPVSYYTVRFNAAGGSVSPESKEVIGEDTYGALPIPSRAGYSFDGWYTAAQGGTRVSENTLVSLTQDATLYARWTEIPPVIFTYTVSFNSNGGSGIMDEQTVVGGRPVALNVNHFTRDGYTFTGWNTAPDGSGAYYVNRASITLGADLTLYAQWAAQSVIYTVRFNATGGTVSPANRRVMTGGPYGLLPTPERTGYVFEGWFTAEVGGSLITSQTEAELTGSQTLYAHWSAIGYTVTFDFGVEGEAPRTKVLSYGQAYGALPVIDRLGYTFLYWQDENGREVSEQSAMLFAKDHTLRAQWRETRYVITFKQNDGSNVTAATRFAVYGQYYGTIMPNTPSRSGYAFTGWYTRPDDSGTEITPATPIETTENLTLYAHWLEGSFTVSYNANGGSGAPQAQIKAAGAPLTLSRTQPKRTGYIFLGWAEEQGAAAPDYQAEGRFARDASVTLYAVWEKETYPVSYDANGGTGAIQAQSKTYGEVLKLSEARPEREGFDFLGWAESRYASSARYQPGGDYSEDAPAMLYAVWARSANTRMPGAADDLSYAFGNTANAFSYGSAFIPQKAYQTMYGDTQRALKYFLAHQLWTGNCFGMVASAGILFENENKIMPSSFSEGKTYARELALTDSSAALHASLQEFVEALQVSQFSELVQYDLEQNKYDGIRHPDALNDLVDRVKRFQETGHDPVLVSVYAQNGQGHALLGYRLEDVNAKTANLWVYDPNYPEDDSRYIVLTKENGNYIGWEYALSKKVTWHGPQRGQAPISFVPYEDIYAVWTGRGPGLGAGGALVSVNMDVDIRDAGGAWLASISDGELDARRSDIYKMDILGVRIDGDGEIIENRSEDNTTYLWLPADRYTVKRAEPVENIEGLLGDVEPLEVSLTHINQSAEVTTEANTVILDVDDGQNLNYVRFEPEDSGSAYSVSLSSGFGEDGQKVSLTGTVDGESGTALTKIEDNAAVMGVSDETATLSINNVEQSIYGGFGTVLIEMPVLVSVSAGEGSGSMPAIAVTGDELTFPDCGFEAPFGQVFAGWKLNDGSRVYQAGEKAAMLNDAVLTALWRESNDKYLVRSARMDGGAVAAQVQNIRGSGGTLLASSYDAGGRLIDVGMQALPQFAPGNTENVLVALLTEEAATVKVFVCDENMRPLGPAYTLERG